MTDKKDNMEIWNAVCETDPAHTKKINQRGGFTAIDAYYQIECATREFGPVGKGWGWEVKDIKFTTQDSVIVLIDLWHGAREQSFQVFGQKDLLQLRGKEGQRPDEDALKKALTDAVTKGLSYLGFNADVFLGKFDDNKYVQSLREGREKATKPAFDGSPQELYDQIKDKFFMCEDEADYKTRWVESKGELNLLKSVSPEMYQALRKELGEIPRKLKSTAASVDESPIEEDEFLPAHEVARLAKNE